MYLLFRQERLVLIPHALDAAIFTEDTFYRFIETPDFQVADSQMEFTYSIRIFGFQPLDKETRCAVTIHPVTSGLACIHIKKTGFCPHCISHSFDTGPKFLIGGITPDTSRFELIGMNQLMV